jgi:hypothetical protein
MTAMIGFGGFERQRKMFAAQFEPAGEGFLYRNHTVGEPIPISAVQRDRYVAGFAKFTKIASWAMLGGAGVLLAAFLLYSVMTKTEVPDLISFGSFGVMVVVYMVAYSRVWNRPARELRGR